MQILKDEIRNKILDVAENLFYQNGFRDTTTRSIANEVGISVSNLYLYYENKEAIFYGVTDRFYEYFVSGFEAFLDHHDKNITMDVCISHYIRKIISTDQKKFVIITDKSQGTKYEGFKQQIISILSNHMKTQLNNNLVQDELVIYILAKNFFEGIIEIAKNYKNEHWLESNINTLVKYHMKGMGELM
ncbi:transcriptional regulator, TetR family [Anaerovirgula multivorans]|uniref:Transcriptional regulator, TetR family n=1 Tax=Anaerovirgula multivorans TaxID=312168 RepID=A0A239LJU3_9FIRM|nr:TetR/AcrR family transcriptional regulator [Anaerovirgula multivorans]SNT30645.1 transcriptional regulator, TetR family [Anaerovirgula multivorans]